MLVLPTIVKTARNTRAIIRCYYRVSAWCLWVDTHAILGILRQEDSFVELVSPSLKPKAPTAPSHNISHNLLSYLTCPRDFNNTSNEIPLPFSVGRTTLRMTATASPLCAGTTDVYAWKKGCTFLSHSFFCYLFLVPYNRTLILICFSGM